MSAPSATGRLQIGGASLVYRTIAATGGGSMPFLFQHGMAAAASLLGQLTRPRAAQNAVILRAFPGSSPTSSIDTWRAVEVPR
jgi:hypothetical protein